jgi:hypothetical protein
VSAKCSVQLILLDFMTPKEWVKQIKFHPGWTVTWPWAGNRDSQEQTSSGHIWRDSVFNEAVIWLKISRISFPTIIPVGTNSRTRTRIIFFTTCFGHSPCSSINLERATSSDEPRPFLQMFSECKSRDLPWPTRYPYYLYNYWLFEHFSSSCFFI